MCAPDGAAFGHSNAAETPSIGATAHPGRKPLPRAGAELDHALAAAGQGDRQAIDQVQELIQPLLTRYCRARIGGQRGADAVSQDICRTVLTALPRNRDRREPFLAFVYRIAARKVAEVPASAPHSRPTSNATRDQLLAALPEPHREILLLRIVLGLTAEETALTMGSTLAAVQLAQHRALTQLKERGTHHQPTR